MREQLEVASASDARSSRCTGTKEFVSGAKGRDKPPALDVEAQGYSPFAPYVDMSPTCRVEAYEVLFRRSGLLTRSPSRLTCDVGLVTSMRPMSLVQSFAGRLCCSIGRHRSAHEHLGELCGRGAYRSALDSGAAIAIGSGSTWSTDFIEVWKSRKSRSELLEEHLKAWMDAATRRMAWPGGDDAQRPGVPAGASMSAKQLIIETRAPIPAKPGQPARHDYEYERNGVANLFMVFAPLEGWRHVKVTDRHTAIDYAHVLRDLSDTHFPDTAKIVLVQDNLNIHKPASLYEAFPAPEARRLVERFEWHYTHKHGSWLDLAESNSAFSRRNVWIAASLTSKSSPTKSPHGTTTATSTTSKPTGNSQPPTPASS